jgi:hypothetical protein
MIGMKKYLLMIFAVCSLVACKKNGVSPGINIVGKWELHERTGGNIIPQDTTYKAGNGNIYQFNKDSSYQQYINGALAVNGTYHLHNSILSFNDNSYGDEVFYYSVAISGNMLTFRPQMPDIATTVYNKIQN